MQDAKLNLAPEWGKTFPKSDKVNHEKVTFHNRYGITLAADLYKPKGAAADTGGLPAGYRCCDNTAGAYLGYFHLYAFSYDEKGDMVKTLYNDFRCNIKTDAIADILTWLLERELVSAGICQDSCSGSLLPPDRYNVPGSLR